MPLLVCSIAISAVTVIYLFWRSYLLALERRHRVLRERVACLLWTLAGVEEDELALRGATFDRRADAF